MRQSWSVFPHRVDSGTAQIPPTRASSQRRRTVTHPSIGAARTAQPCSSYAGLFVGFLIDPVGAWLYM